MGTIATRRNEINKFKTNTSETYRGIVKRYLISNKEEGPGSLTRQSICDHLNRLKAEKTGSGQRKYSDSTIELDCKYLLCEYVKQSSSEAERKERIEEAKKIKKTFVPKVIAANCRNKAIKKDDIQKLIENLPDRLSLIVETLAETGMRISELINLKYEDKDPEMSNIFDTYFWIIGKGNKKRPVFISNELLQRIQSTFQNSIYLFTTDKEKPYHRSTITRDLNKLSEKIIGKKIHAHTFRHSFITNEIDSGQPIDAVSKFVGHFSAGFTLDRYSHNTITKLKTKYKGKMSAAAA